MSNIHNVTQSMHIIGLHSLYIIKSQIINIRYLLYSVIKNTKYSTLKIHLNC